MGDVSIMRFRKLGGTWTAERNGWVWVYRGVLDGHTYTVRSYAHAAPQYDGDDDSFVTLWHTERDGKPWGFPTTDPVVMIAEWDRPCQNS